MKLKLYINRSFFIGLCISALGFLVISIVQASTSVGQNITTTGDLTVSGQATISGNVGVGLVSPTERLDVNGNIKTTSCVKYNGWSNVSVPGTETLNSITFLDSTTGVTVGTAGKLYRTANGGSVWTAVTSNTANALHGVAFSGATGAAVGDSGTIVRSTNSGASWTALATPGDTGTSNNLLGVAFPDSSTGVAVGASGTIVRSTNSGATWGAVASGTANILYGVAFASSTTGVAVGASGTIIRTTNAGASWSEATSGITTDLNAVTFVTSSIGFAIGNAGVVLRTDNAGTSWTSVTGITGAHLAGIRFSTSTNGVIVAEDGLIFRTTNGGVTWSVVESGISLGLSDTAAADSTTFVAVGVSTTLLQSTDGGSGGATLNSGTCLDVAELYQSADSELREGMFVRGVFKNGTISAEKSKQAYDNQLLGVVSSTPAIVIEGGSVVFGSPRVNSKSKTPVALMGRVPALVNLENGPINVGDAITASSVSGIGMKATRSGKIVGFALESFNTETQKESLILVQLSLQTYSPYEEIEALKQEIITLKKLWASQ